MEEFWWPVFSVIGNIAWREDNFVNRLGFTLAQQCSPPFKIAAHLQRTTEVGKSNGNILVIFSGL